MDGGGKDRADRGESSSEAAGDQNRARVLSTIKHQPGLNLGEIAQELDLSRNTVRYHIRRLGNKIVGIRQGHHLLHFSVEIPSAQRKALALLRVASIRYLVGRLMDRQEIRADEVAHDVDMTARSVRRAIQKLVKADLASHVDRPASENHTGKGVWHVTLEPAMRVAWALWCQDAEEAPPSPLYRSTGWLFLVDSLVWKLLLAWSSHRDEWV